MRGSALQAESGLCTSLQRRAASPLALQVSEGHGRLPASRAPKAPRMLHREAGRGSRLEVGPSFTDLQALGKLGV